jgi:hypothetical protein
MACDLRKQARDLRISGPERSPGFELSIDELAEYLAVPVRTLYDWRLSGRGPRALHVGPSLRYRASATCRPGSTPSSRGLCLLVLT